MLAPAGTSDTAWCPIQSKNENTALKATNTSAAPAIKAGHDAVMHRWLMSAQKLRRRPSAITSRPPIRTIRDLDFCSLRLVAILFESLRALGGYFKGGVIVGLSGFQSLTMLFR